MFERKEPYKEGELNIKTPEEAEAKGNEMMTPTQREASERQERNLKESGIIMLSSDTEGGEIPEEDKKRWPNAFKVSMLSGQLKDGRKIALKVAYLRKPFDNSKTDFEYVGTINDQLLPEHVTKSLYEKYCRPDYQFRAKAKDYYKDAEKANQEVSSGANSSLWEDLL